MGVILQVFYSAFSSVLLSLAIPNEIFTLGYPAVTILALIPFYYAISQCRNFKTAFILGFIQTCVTHLLSSFWLAYFMDFAAFTLGASAFGTGFIGGVFGCIIYMPYNSSNKKNRLLDFSIHQDFFRTKTFKIFYFAAVYTIYEWVKSTGFLGYPWGTVSSALYTWNYLTQIAAITGTYGLTFLIAFLNGTLSELIFTIIPDVKKGLLNESSQNVFYFAISLQFIAILFAVSLIYGSLQLNKKRIPEKYLTTIMVQQNSDPWKEKKDHDSIIRSQKLTLDKLKELKAEGKKADFVVWSEGCLRSSFPHSYRFYSIYPGEKPLTEFIREINVPFLAGGRFIKDAMTADINNAALVFDEQSNLRGYYGKNHLVPFAESIPGRENEAVRTFLKKVLRISAGWTPGDQYVFFDIPGKWNKNRLLPKNKYIDLSKTFDEQKADESKAPVIRISTPICFDDAFPDVMEPLFKGGSELFVNITDDSWSLKKSSELQHFVIASFAAIEYRTTMLRSSNSGYSCVITPTGKVLADSPLFTDYALSYDVPVYKREITFYSRFRNTFVHLMIFMLVIYLIIEYSLFEENDYIPSARKLKKHHKKHGKKHSHKK